MKKVSYGGGRFTQRPHKCFLYPQPAFSVHKTPDPCGVSVVIHSAALAQRLEPFGFSLFWGCNVLQVFQHHPTMYTQLLESLPSRKLLSDERWWSPSPRELKLFVEDFLSDGSIFCEAENSRPGTIPTSIWSQMQKRKAPNDADRLQNALDSLRNAFDDDEQHSHARGKGCPDANDDTEAEVHSSTSDIHDSSEDVRQRDLVSRLHNGFYQTYKRFGLWRRDKWLPSPSLDANGPRRLRIPTDHRTAWKDSVRIIIRLLRGRLSRKAKSQTGNEKLSETEKIDGLPRKEIVLDITPDQAILCAILANAKRNVTDGYSCTQETYVQYVHRVTTTDLR